MSANNLITIGRIYREHGVKGYCKVYAYENELSFFQSRAPYRLVSTAGESLTTSITEVKPAGRYFLVKFAALQNPEAVVPWRKAEIKTTRASLPESYGKTLFDFEWQGFEVYDQRQNKIGLIQAIEYDPLKQFIIQISGRKEPILVPYVEDWFVTLDRQEKKLVLNLPEGLVES